MVIDTSEIQLEKANIPIDVTLCGMVIDASEVQS
jgi:hypothetical protein